MKDDINFIIFNRVMQSFITCCINLTYNHEVSLMEGLTPDFCQSLENFPYTVCKNLTNFLEMTLEGACESRIKGKESLFKNQDSNCLGHLKIKYTSW